jgi:hypothetical protein
VNGRLGMVSLPGVSGVLCLLGNSNRADFEPYELARDGSHTFVDAATFGVILAVSTKFRGGHEMLDNRRSEKKGELLAERGAMTVR